MGYYISCTFHIILDGSEIFVRVSVCWKLYSKADFQKLTQ